MTIQEVKQRKRDLEDMILDSIMTFQRDTGTVVDRIETKVYEPELGPELMAEFTLIVRIPTY